MIYFNKSPLIIELDNLPLIVYVNGPIAVFMLISVVWLVVISVTLFKVKTKELAKDQAKKG